MEFFLAGALLGFAAGGAFVLCLWGWSEKQDDGLAAQVADRVVAKLKAAGR